jgi:hypothetical protein
MTQAEVVMAEEVLCRGWHAQCPRREWERHKSISFHLRPVRGHR